MTTPITAAEIVEAIALARESLSHGGQHTFLARALLAFADAPVPDATRLRAAAEFMREAWHNDGAEGETAHLLANGVDALLAYAARVTVERDASVARAEAAQAEHDDWIASVAVEAEARASAERERDVAVARAEWADARAHDLDDHLRSARDSRVEQTERAERAEALAKAERALLTWLTDLRYVIRWGASEGMARFIASRLDAFAAEYAIDGDVMAAAGRVRAAGGEP